MSVPEEVQPLFAQQVAVLANGQAAGRESFDDAALEVLGFVARYPDLVLGDGLERTDGLEVVVYEAAFKGLHEAIQDQQLRRRFARSVQEQLEAAEAGGGSLRPVGLFSGLRHPALIGEALHNSFIDELGVPDRELDGLLEAAVNNPPLFGDKRHPSEIAKRGAFRQMVRTLIDKAEAIEEAIEETNTYDNLIIVSSSGDDPELEFTQYDDEYTKRIIKVGIVASGPCFVERRAERTQNGKTNTHTLRVEETDFMTSSRLGIPDCYSGLGGTLYLPGEPIRHLSGAQSVQVTNSLLGQINEELDRRQIEANTSLP